MAGLKTKPEYEGLAEAVSLGIAVLKKSKQNTWAELVDGMNSGNLLVVKAFKALDLTDAQLETVNAWQSVLNLVKINPAVIPVICPVCEYYVLTADTAPSRCMVTAGCEGKPFKVAAATGITAAKAAAAPAAAETQPEPEEAPAKAAPAKRAAKKTGAASDPMIEHMPDDFPEPDPVAEAQPPAGPSPEEPPAPAKSPDAAPALDLVVVADDEDPFA
ncbi:hypothetical protein Achl_4416 (plasmid) [Pseudarthrobacter chlorophenolicus A6]|uniref:Uncharacterized protein n=1 Tax=Pseudarthrobacter chlorophenolicus (strain ATCC 700700 / DSM 12829 / CIP 107037 / JCM 12360 / KCTC 9906 / NCIMB 13794 / A6) TaxID=452863 RepID=B8HIX0_PSECP|nr:hypothetical protein [Pseudarthrobacter chlorophenolicus]ACL42367.1 hypothetical protein Achl_4416 [Pseudarthrobacter chlorophenolicus A6]SDQ17145.1 hypothetical protein SAMN04489738_0473 [Pseudarthrobacter chlorophenolicus]